MKSKKKHSLIAWRQSPGSRSVHWRSFPARRTGSSCEDRPPCPHPIHPQKRVRSRKSRPVGRFPLLSSCKLSFFLFFRFKFTYRSNHNCRIHLRKMRAVCANGCCLAFKNAYSFWKWLDARTRSRKSSISIRSYRNPRKKLCRNTKWKRKPRGFHARAPLCSDCLNRLFGLF